MAIDIPDVPEDFFSEVDGVKVAFRPFVLPNARIVHGNVFPLCLSVEKVDGGKISVDETAAALRDISSRGITTELMNKHGALLIRGPRDPSAKAFSKLVHAAEEGRGHEPYDQIGLAGSRTVHDKEVFSASESPQHLWIYHHNEYSRYTKFPSNIHFFCHIAAEEGGESPFCHSAELFDRIQEDIPEFVEEAARRGLNSPDIYRAPGKEGKNFIFTWAGPLAFGREITPEDDMATKKAKAEKQVVKLTPHFWWREDDQLEVHQHVPAFRRHPATGKPLFFTSIPGRYGVALDRKATDPPYIGDDGMAYPPASWTDGEPIPKKYLHRCWEITNECQVSVKMEPGDMALVDNYQVTHARAPWTKGERKVMVSMWDTKDPAEKILEY
ncbi:Clavaminate synthase-like protein [Lepidopterella palustris CBS 459.81]|uniref:Clavaminate synthase-like protein n=1 Tax=Lepidopterella palustris CBS 459.81 TaxID=1314670 RepID=A0A8E2E130_9PEZI|nr:Clavaminate synthase-like protein [Lepidopterella palustris CBS 459.81]